MYEELLNPAAMDSMTPYLENHFTMAIEAPGGKSGVLRLGLVDITFPKYGVDTQTLKFMNSSIKVATNVKPIDNITASLRDLVDKDVAQAIFDWYEKIYDPATGKIFCPASYKVTGQIMQFACADKEVQRVYPLVGVFPSNIDTGKGDYNSNAVKILKVDFSIDRLLMPTANAGS